VNEIGDGPVSDSTLICAAGLPGPPDAPVEIDATQTSITVGWKAPQSSGSSPIIGYKLYWNAGSGAMEKSPYYDSENSSVF
jgi:hypothetical protein